MHQKTIEYYNTNASEFVRRTQNADMSFCQNKFISYLPQNGMILDAGCGSGRDSRYFLERGFCVEAVDASDAMCKIASEYIGQPIACINFEEIEYRERYDGIWASASLLHVEKKSLPNVLKRFQKALKEKGILYASLKFGAGEEVRLERFFCDYTLDELQRVFLQDGLFELVEAFETEDGRAGYEEKPWVNIIVRKK